MNGKLIVIEGLDGCGKTLQSSLLAEYLKKNGTDVRQVSFPDYESDSSKPLRMYLSGKLGTSPDAVNAYAASSFFAVDRYISFRTGWQTDYENGSCILANRYTTANAFHQMCKLPGSEWDGFLEWLFDYEYRLLGLPEPDLVMLLYMELEASAGLLSKRYEGDESKKDIHESSANYLSDAAECALYAAKRCGWNVINCSRDGKPLRVDDIHDMIRNTVNKSHIF